MKNGIIRIVATNETSIIPCGEKIIGDTQKKYGSTFTDLVFSSDADFQEFVKGGKKPMIATWCPVLEERLGSANTLSVRLRPIALTLEGLREQYVSINEFGKLTCDFAGLITAFFSEELTCEFGNTNTCPRSGTSQTEKLTSPSSSS